MNTFFQSTIILSILSTLLLATACDDSSSSSSTCATGEVRCEGRCIDPLTDRGFCGAAEACEENPGTPCAAGFLCEAGQCVLSCQAGLIDCDGTCIDPTTDRLHCGASSPCDQSPGVACGDGLLCDGAGACTTVCTQGRVECGGTCIDPATDRLHCGAADPCDQNPGLACDDGYLCDAGQCVLSCQDDLIECGGICIDPATDRLHCGAADPCDQNPGLACGDGYLCDAGQCVLSCRAGFIECDGACIDPATDRLHCGAADPCDQNPGLACGDGYLCDGTGGCALSCQENLVECDGTCIDPATDRLHCGAADPCDQNPGLACGDGYLCDGTGGCALSCQENLVECDGTCIDPATDRFHCGASDPCDTNPGFACEDGYLCDGDGGCALSCQENLVECDGTCIDPATDRFHCGASDPCDTNPGFACEDGYLCDGDGGCVLSCQAGLIDCGGTCINPDFDRDYCGAADPCDLNPGTPCLGDLICDGHGSCAALCSEGLTNCGNTCVDLFSDPDHCGGCGLTCAVGAECINGDCTAPQDCKTLLSLIPAAPSGLYAIDPDGAGSNPPFQVFCDMVTDGGGWTLVLNRLVDSDNLGQPDLNVAHGAFDNTRATNWNFDIDLFWSQATQVVFADKENNACSGCGIGSYDSAIRIDRPAGGAWSVLCPSISSSVPAQKLVGPSAGTVGTAFTCANTLGWGSCGGNVCHYGTHYQNTNSDGSWSSNAWNEMHFPSAYSSYRSYGDVNNPPSAWCRSCGGALSPVLNLSSTCCNNNTYNARSRWTLWVR